MNSYGLRELTPGMRIALPDTDCSEQRVLAYAEIMDAKHPIHVDEAYARSTPFGRRIAHGPFAVASSLAAVGKIFGDNLLALLEVGPWRFMQPAFLGDVLRTEAFVSSLDRSRGIVVLDIRIYGADGQLVQHGQSSLLLRRD